MATSSRVNTSTYMGYDGPASNVGCHIYKSWFACAPPHLPSPWPVLAMSMATLRHFALNWLFIKHMYTHQAHVLHQRRINI